MMAPTDAQWLSPYVVTRNSEPKVDMIAVEGKKIAVRECTGSFMGPEAILADLRASDTISVAN